MGVPMNNIYIPYIKLRIVMLNTFKETGLSHQLILTLKLSFSHSLLKNVIRVRLTKRINYYQALKNTVVRLGNTDRTGSAQALFNEDNTYVGCVVLSSPQEASHDFNFVEASSGRYLTIQTVQTASLAIDEINVYTG